MPNLLSTAFSKNYASWLFTEIFRLPSNAIAAMHSVKTRPMRQTNFSALPTKICKAKALKRQNCHIFQKNFASDQESLSRPVQLLHVPERPNGSRCVDHVSDGN